MKTIALTLTVAFAALATTALADRRHVVDRDSFTDEARVVRVEPIYHTISSRNPRRECWEEEVFYSVDDGRDDTAARMIIGGAIGGALGHNLGHHSDTAKIAGAVIGSAIGYDSAQRHRGRQKLRRGVEERCHTVYETSSRQRVDGYRVTYRYRGQLFSTIMDDDPGKHLRLRITLTPLD